jgi:endonuclease/exonuclease/phosphatase family metal-dependent hydrolase
MRLMTYNIRSCLGMDGRRDIVRIARVIRDSGADIVCIQELDEHLPRSGFRYQSRELEGATGLRMIFQRTIDLRLAGYGIAVGSRFSVEEIRNHALPSTGEPRGCVEVRLGTPGGRVHVLCAHLGLSDEERVLQVDAIATRIRDLSGPILLAGDFNEPPASRAVCQLIAESRLIDASPDGGATFPADAPGSRIDYVFHSPAVKVTSARVVDTQASDHLPVVVDFEVV